MTVRQATLADAHALASLEQAVFSSDRLSLRQFKHHLRSAHAELWLAEDDVGVLGYGLVLLRRGTRLARLYSLAVDPRARGQGIAGRLLQTLEHQARQRGRVDLRLEVAQNNLSAQALYIRHGYQPFDVWSDYYADHQAAVRMQKRLHRSHPNESAIKVPWLAQSTEFTCGPAALQMALAALQPGYTASRTAELQLWREATTIFMTSGHGGCHPIGLALAAHARGLHAQVWLSTAEALFVDGVRQPDKKEVLDIVHQQFVEQAQQQSIGIEYAVPSPDQVRQCLSEGGLCLALISTWRWDRRKAPHWVLLVDADEHGLYVHDPDGDEHDPGGIDAAQVPLAWSDFLSMASYGRSKLRAYVMLHAQASQSPTLEA
nr:GNAT family N-acetyltransferase/peptidase C39 family protein [Oceanococcus sp. HetDA_MAG_MS8]